MKLNKEQRRLLNEKLKAKRQNLPSNKKALDEELKKRTLQAKGRAKKVMKLLAMSDDENLSERKRKVIAKLRERVETGAKAVAISVGEGEGIKNARQKVDALGVSDDDHAAALSLIEQNEPTKPDKEE
jgi:hypothetical protein